MNRKGLSALVQYYLKNKFILIKISRDSRNQIQATWGLSHLSNPACVLNI